MNIILRPYCFHGSYNQVTHIGKIYRYEYIDIYLCCFACSLQFCKYKYTFGLTRKYNGCLNLSWCSVEMNLFLIGFDLTNDQRCWHEPIHWCWGEGTKGVVVVVVHSSLPLWFEGHHNNFHSVRSVQTSLLKKHVWLAVVLHTANIMVTHTQLWEKC